MYSANLYAASFLLSEFFSIIYLTFHCKKKKSYSSKTENTDRVQRGRVDNKGASISGTSSCINL